MCDATPATTGTLPYTVKAPALARDFVRGAVCPEHGLIAETAAMLLASELVTHAVLHGAPPVSLTIACQVNRIEIEVADSSTAEVQPFAANDGLAMMLVDKVATEWGTRRTRSGRVVWCTVPTGFIPQQRPHDRGRLDSAGASRSAEDLHR